MARVVLWRGSTLRGRGRWGVLSSPSPTGVPGRSCTPWVRVARLVLCSLVQTLWLLVVRKNVLGLLTFWYNHIYPYNYFGRHQSNENIPKGGNLL